jgi:hypothetical protein
MNWLNGKAILPFDEPEIMNSFNLVEIRSNLFTIRRLYNKLHNKIKYCENIGTTKLSQNSKVYS